jgi:DNA-binding NarL/FixJ family response regulator
MSAVSATPCVLVVDDDEPFRALMRGILERAGFEVADASDARSALEAAKADAPDLVLADVVLPEISGYELMRELHHVVGEQLPVILVSGTRTDKEDVLSGLMLGADDYLSKPFDPDELLVRVRRSLALRSLPKGRAASREPTPLDDLTSRELEVLGLLADGLSQSEVATQLVVSPRTVGTHIQHILSKLDVHSRTQAVALALRNGLNGDVRGHHKARA